MSGDRIFTLGSLFSGIGGLELGLEMTGRFKTVWQVEQSEYCRKVLRRHWPDALQFEDVRNVGKGNLPAVDVICGGFPCQDISYAGLGAGLDGEQSGLWYEFARIVREVGPRFVVVENVSALLSRGIGEVLGTLADLGYDARWSRLSAADVGAPHLRERIFIVADADSGRRNRFGSHGGNGRPLQAQGLEWVIRGGRSREGCVADAHRERGRGWNPQREDATDARESSRCAELGNWHTEPNVGRVANGVPKRVDRLRALGNAVVPQCARVIGEWLLEIDAELQSGEAA